MQEGQDRLEGGGDRCGAGVASPASPPDLPLNLRVKRGAGGGASYSS